ncbi:hypothetical protein F53441_12455 [Fusarium austroafricanum]|uniref:Kinetoplast-associated protein KAP n=1 Tax=Fusarium austroafricanum TaxID=2364996 RepID=A0A8H4NVS4_9HYPO|nr:hypothetical protein F53441_12455 [Fusarium austroafricanum]
METPLSPAQDSSLNIQTPVTTKRYDAYEVRTVSVSSETQNESSQRSSPFVSTVNDTALSDQENRSPTKSRHSRVLSGATLSPLKILADHREVRDGRPTDRLSPSARSPRKVSPEKRFPVKVSNPLDTPRAATIESTMSLEDAVRQNEGLKRAIEIFEDEQSVLEDDQGDMKVTTGPTKIDPAGQMEVDESMCPDDTMASTFSTFSAVPNLTMFAKLGQSPTKLSDIGGLTPRANTRADHSPSRTPRARPRHDSGNTTNLLDFTEQLRFPQKSPSKGGLSPSRTAPDVATTPSRNGFANLIDFDIPPMPTPRSVPSITARELESLKSNFLSEISSLKASLSGKEAEVQSLKAAVGDAEKRVGESQEQLRDERTIKEQLAAEKEGWENRGREMENVLRKVKEEIVVSQREQEELEQKLEESEKRREAAEILHQEAESKMAGMRAGKDTDKSSPEKPMSPSNTNHEVEIAVERVARELHALYKSKHESKVTALKKSYETRWEKRVHELESKIEELTKENERLRLGRDTSMTKVEPDSVKADERKAQAVRDSATIKELNADIQRLEAVVETVQLDNESLRSMLEKERVEKGELVQLAEEMMNMQSFVAQTPKPQQQSQQPQSASRYPHERQHDREPEAKTPKRSADHFRSSVSRASGLRAPGSGLRAPHERTKSAGGLPRPGSMARSGIMSSIEKMGNYRGRGAE